MRGLCPMDSAYHFRHPTPDPVTKGSPPPCRSWKMWMVLESSLGASRPLPLRPSPGPVMEESRALRRSRET
jgi:hypothetical protein